MEIVQAALVKLTCGQECAGPRVRDVETVPARGVHEPFTVRVVDEGEREPGGARVVAAAVQRCDEPAGLPVHDAAEAFARCLSMRARQLAAGRTH